MQFSQKRANKHRDLWPFFFHTFMYIPVTKLASSVTKKIPPQTHDTVFYTSFSVWIIIPRIFQTWFKTLICVLTALGLWVYDNVMAFPLPLPQQITFSIHKKKIADTTLISLKIWLYRPDLSLPLSVQKGLLYSNHGYLFFKISFYLGWKGLSLSQQLQSFKRIVYHFN